jgi:hypothetical protein
MTIYPAEFHRRCEQKWERRAEVSRLYESTRRTARADGNQCGQRMPDRSERNDILARRPWLLAIGRTLRAEQNAVEQPVSERLAALLKELEGPTRHLVPQQIPPRCAPAMTGGRAR